MRLKSNVVVTKENAKDLIEKAHIEAEGLGGWKSFRDGSFLLKLVRKHFHESYDRCNVDYLHKRHKTKDCDVVCQKLTIESAQQGAIIGLAVGALLSLDEILLLMTSGGATLTLPVNLIVVSGAIMSELVLLVKLQLDLVASISKLHGIKLDPEDEGQVLKILAYAMGGSMASAIAKREGQLGRKSLEAVGKRLGVRLLRRTMLKYTIPLASIGLGSGFNYLSIRSLGNHALSHLNGGKKKSPKKTLKPIASLSR